MHAIVRAAAGRLVPFTALLLFAALAAATPPDPPVRLVLPERLASVTLRDGRLELPLTLESTGEARDVVVSVRTRRLLPDTPDFEQPRPERVQELKPRAKRGRQVLAARVDAQVQEHSIGEPAAPRELAVDARGGVRVQRPEEYSREGEDARVRAFREDLARHPEHPRIRLLRESLAAVREADVREHDVAASARMEVRASGPSRDLARYYRDRTADAWQPEDPLTVRGRLTFLDVDGTWRPLVNVAVHVWDEDTFGDELLGTLATGWDGRWSFAVNNDDGWLQDGRDIYFTATLANTRLEVGRCDGDYRWQSDVREDSDDGTVIDFGNLTPATSTDAVVVWDRLNLSWNHVTTAGGRDPGLIRACYPAASTNFTTTVNIAANRFDGDSVAHEYGHALMFNAYGEKVSPGGAHNFGECGQDTGLSWAEGFATGFMLSVFPDGTYNWNFGDMGQPIEAFGSTCRQGETQEGWVAGALSDMRDGPNDANGGNDDLGRDDYGDENSAAPVSLASIYRDTMWGSLNPDTLDFWYDLSGSLSGATRAGAAEIMYYNWMSVLPPDACVATKAATARLADAEADVVLGDLRKFRDQVLERGNRGRELVNRYYRNSPEMAALLLADARATDDALFVIRHFASFGATVSSNRRYRDAFAANAAIVPADVDAAVARLFDFFARRGGDTLKRDAELARSAYQRVKSLTLPQLQQRLEEESAGEAKKVRLEPGRFSPESERALETPGVRSLREKGLPKPPAY